MRVVGPVQDSFGGLDGDLLSIDLKASSPFPLYSWWWWWC